MFLRLGLLLWAGVVATPIRLDACAAIAGETFSKPADALACLRSFPFNETLRQNILSIVSRVLDSFTFEDYYPKSSFPFPTKVDIRAELARINSTSYVVSSCGYFIVDSADTFQTDYDFNLDLYNSINKMNDGHTGEYHQLSDMVVRLYLRRPSMDATLLHELGSRLSHSYRFTFCWWS